MRDRRQYMNEYHKKRYAERRALALGSLGGKCKHCGKTTDLEIDHVEPTDKEMTFPAMAMASMQRFLKELSKCQLLCGECHDKKSIVDRNTYPARGTHGTLASYRYCKCDLCRAANTAYGRLRRARRSAQAQM